MPVKSLRHEIPVGDTAHLRNYFWKYFKLLNNSYYAHEARAKKSSQKEPLQMFFFFDI